MKYIIDASNSPFVVKEVRIIDKIDGIYICKDDEGKISKLTKRNWYHTREKAEEKLNEIIFVGKYKTKMMNKKTKSWTCRYCGTKMYNRDDVTVDHIKPVSKGGKTTDSNLLICCKTCNKSKSSKHKNHYKNLLDGSGKRKLKSPSKFNRKVRYLAHNKHEGNMLHIAKLDSRIISIDSVTKKENMVDKVLRQYNESRR